MEIIKLVDELSNRLSEHIAEKRSLDGLSMFEYNDEFIVVLKIEKRKNTAKLTEG